MLADMASSLKTLEAELDAALAVALDVQARRDEARARAGLSVAPPVVFSISMAIGALSAADDRHRVEMREMVAAVIADVRYQHDPGYRPDRHHAALIELAASFRSNVVPLTNARPTRRT